VSAMSRDPAPEGWSWRERDGHRYLAHDTAVIDERAHIGEGSVIGERVVIGEDARIGARVRIGERVVIGEDARIGDAAHIGERTRIGRLARIGEYARIGDRGCGLVTGTSLGYLWTAYRSRDGEGYLSYGCETLSWAEWRRCLGDLCARYQPRRAEQYMRAITALLDAAPALLDATEIRDTQGTKAGTRTPYVVGRGVGGFIEVVDPMTGLMEQFSSIESASSRVSDRLRARMDEYERVRREQAARVAEMHRLDTLFSELWQLKGRDQ